MPEEGHKKRCDAKRFEAGLVGFTLVELLVVTLIVSISVLTVGMGFVKLAALEDLNREKALALEALCARVAWTQPRVAVGSRVLMVEPNHVSIRYPHVVFGIGCETNQFTQVTNCSIMVRNDGVLQTVVYAGRGQRVGGITNSMDWMDPLFIGSEQPRMQHNRVTMWSSNRLSLTYAFNVKVGDLTDSVTLTLPIQLRNSRYE